MEEEKDTKKEPPFGIGFICGHCHKATKYVGQSEKAYIFSCEECGQGGVILKKDV